jgi:membrane protein
VGVCFTVAIETPGQLSKPYQTASKRGKITCCDPQPGGHIATDKSSVDPRLDRRNRQIWEFVSQFPLRSLWNVHGITLRTLTRSTWNAVIEDRVLGHAAELGFYFFFALFPTLLCASAILGLAARSAHQIYVNLLDYLAVVIPTSALGMVLATFKETTDAASAGKATLGLIVAVWSAAVGISAIQDTMNAVYKIVDTRSYFMARIHAIGLTLLMTLMFTLGLASLFGSDHLARLIDDRISGPVLGTAAALTVRGLGRIAGLGFLALAFAAIYYWAPDCRRRRWHWLTPGSAIGITGWLAASFGLRLYLHFFDSYTLTYGSLGAVIILLMWFYISGLMILLGAEINSVIEVAAAVRSLSSQSAGESL